MPLVDRVDGDHRPRARRLGGRVESAQELAYGEAAQVELVQDLAPRLALDERAAEEDERRPAVLDLVGHRVREQVRLPGTRSTVHQQQPVIGEAEAVVAAELPAIVDCQHQLDQHVPRPAAAVVQPSPVRGVLLGRGQVEQPPERGLRRCSAGCAGNLPVSERQIPVRHRASARRDGVGERGRRGVQIGYDLDAGGLRQAA